MILTEGSCNDVPIAVDMVVGVEFRVGVMVAGRQVNLLTVRVMSGILFLTGGSAYFYSCKSSRVHVI